MWLQRRGTGGAEVYLTLLFADVRGSTALAETMPAADYATLIGRFFDAATRAFVDGGAIIDKLVGDSAATGHAGRPWLPIGIGVLVSEPACAEAGLDTGSLETRSLTLKGKAQPVRAVVLRPA